MNEREAVQSLRERGRFGVRLGLGRTRALLSELGDPHLGLRGALIAGTNGKGSVQALVASVLQESGVRVGQAPKPHLVSYRERIVVDGRPIASQDFADLIAHVLDVANRVPKRLGPLTEFELVTAAAFTWFARAAVQVGVIEVGLGGRLDATNAWDGGVAAITNIDLDHMEWLGPTVQLIAGEKAAIIKRGDLAVTGAGGAALEVIQTAARRAGAPLEITEALPLVSSGRAGIVVRDFALGEVSVALLGPHQAANVAVALGVLRALERRGICRPGEEAIRVGLARACWPGRMELLTVDERGVARPASSEGPDPGSVDVLLDGAHNAAGAAALAVAVDDLERSLSAGRATLLFGVLSDKDVMRIARGLAGSRRLAGASVVTTTVPDTPRALPAAEVAAAWRKAAGADARVEVEEMSGVALERALAIAREARGPLIVAGSLYLVGEVRGKLLPEPNSAVNAPHPVASPPGAGSPSDG